MGQQEAGRGGPEALPEPARVAPIAGELVTETFDYDGGRHVTVYVPPNPPDAVVFAGDGQGISAWAGFLEAADVPSTMIVGVGTVFLDNATRWAVALRDAGADVVTSERVASHDDTLWRAEFPLMVAWAFG
jgi:hypothetical protein